MDTMKVCSWLIVLAQALATMSADAATGPYTLLHSIPALPDSHRNQETGSDGNITVEGNAQDGSWGPACGVVNVYEATTRTLLYTLTNPTPAALDFFGCTVAISGKRIVVGAIGDDTGAQDAGSAYVYDLASATPTVPVAILNNPKPAQADWFSYAVAISGTRVVIGAPLVNLGVGDAGASYVYDLASPTPTLPVLTLNNPTPEYFDTFGHSVAISGTRVVIGTPHDNTFAFHAGVAYLYHLAGTTPTIPAAILNHPRPAASQWFGWVVAFSGERVAVSAARERQDSPQYDGGTYVYASASSGSPAITQVEQNAAVIDGLGNAIDGDGGGTPTGTHLRPEGTSVASHTTKYITTTSPALSIVSAARGFAIMSWTPTNSPGFVLQYTDTLAPANWMNASSGAMNPVSVPTTTVGRFYRLARP